ncbi:hypothetical protein BC826DRAFT_914267 [Russula brevipes]|nr:hypothetical protein BC826DRAFT_914267 [Russula brevipes]
MEIIESATGLARTRARARFVLSFRSLERDIVPLPFPASPLPSSSSVHPLSPPCPCLLFPMATIGPPPPGSVSASIPQPQPIPANPDQITWDGDKMFNIYILDYCKKRGYHKTANQLVAEADIPPESKPPINAQQGLLFESVPLYRSLLLSAHSAPIVLVVDGGVSSGCYFRPKTAATEQRTPCSTIKSVSSTSFIFVPF